jgi:hypothetical protein
MTLDRLEVLERDRSAPAIARGINAVSLAGATRRLSRPPFENARRQRSQITPCLAAAPQDRIGLPL